MRKQRLAFVLLAMFICSQMTPLVFAQGSTNYRIPSDVQGAGGGDEAKSSNYMLLDTIGEPNIGPSRTANYDVNAGYRQREDGTFISLNCSPTVDLGTIIGNGQNTNDGTCTVITDAAAGYSLQWTAGPGKKQLVAYWPLDESSSTSAYDVSGNGNTGAHTGSPTISTDVPTNYTSTRSLSLNGSSQYVSIPTESIFDFKHTDPFTLSAWVKRNSAGGYDEVISKTEGASNYRGYRMLLTPSTGSLGNNSSLMVDLINTYPSNYIRLTTPTNSITTGVWHHVAFTYDGSSTAAGVKVYINGVEQTKTVVADTLSATIVSSSNVGIGVSPAELSHYFDGNIDEPRIFSRVLEPEQVRDLASPYPPGSLVATNLSTYIPPYNLTFSGSLVGHYRLDDYVGTIAADASRYDNDATLTGGPTYSTSIPAAINSRTYRSVLFDGSDDYIITPNMQSYFSNDDVTISVWFYPTAGGVIIDELGQTSINTGWHDSQIEVLSTGEVRARVWNLSSVSLGTANMNAWNHAVLRYRDSTDVLDGFLNGVQSSTSSGNRQTPFVDGGVGLYYAFGVLDSTNVGDGTYFNGNIDDVRIYNAALSDAQIQTLYALPQAWSVATTESAFGARLRSSSTDTDAKWGTDGGSSKWLNVGDGSMPLVTRSSRTSVSGSTEVIQFRAEIGSAMVQPAANYTSTVMFTAVGL